MVSRRKLKQAQKQARSAQQIVAESRALLLLAGFQIESDNQVPDALRALLEELQTGKVPDSVEIEETGTGLVVAAPAPARPILEIEEDDEILLGAPIPTAARTPSKVPANTAQGQAPKAAQAPAPAPAIDPAAFQAKLDAKLRNAEKNGIKRSVSGGGGALLKAAGGTVPTKIATPPDEQRRILEQITGKKVQAATPGRPNPAKTL